MGKRWERDQYREYGDDTGNSPSAGTHNRVFPGVGNVHLNSSTAARTSMVRELGR
jgi:hypothetical protein